MGDFFAFFLAEIWFHRRNRFIAVGGSAVLSLFVTFAVQPIPWIPESLKSAIAIVAAILMFVTILLMVYYLLKFLFVALVWAAKRIVGSGKRDRHGIVKQV